MVGMTTITFLYTTLTAVIKAKRPDVPQPDNIIPPCSFCNTIKYSPLLI